MRKHRNVIPNKNKAEVSERDKTGAGPNMATGNVTF